MKDHQQILKRRTTAVQSYVTKSANVFVIWPMIADQGQNKTLNLEHQNGSKLSSKMIEK